jgi:hypothetical protein
MTSSSADAIAPAAGTSGTIQSTYCGEKLFENATSPVIPAAHARIIGSRRHRQNST